MSTYTSVRPALSSRSEIVLISRAGHRFDYDTPIEETVSVHFLIRLVGPNRDVSLDASAT